jgi:hypothetical protein
MCLEKGKMEPPEMAVFSFIDLPDVLTHKKRRTHREQERKKENKKANIK